MKQFQNNIKMIDFILLVMSLLTVPIAKKQ